MMAQHEIQAAAVKRHARELGFDLVGIAPVQRSQRADYFRDWLSSSQNGEMKYLAARFDERTDPAVYLPGAASVVCVAMNYFVPLEASPTAQGRIARYALGDDYHEVFKPRLHALADWLKAQAPDAQTRCAVDTAPVMEKELAARAGVGWMGKNTCIINPRIGSWLFLGEVLTTLALTPDEAAEDRCGTCTRCIEACPTGAITAPYQLDARKCISYLTIEHRGEIQPDLQNKMGDWLYGCDVCQDVCPWNGKAIPSLERAFAPRFPTGTVNLAEVTNWTDEDYRRTLRNSAMKRVKLPVLMRNASLIKKRNAG